MPPPRAICFIIFCASPKRSRSWLTSEVLTPAPLAMRARREPLICLGWLRSKGVIEKTIASTRSNSFSSKASSWARIWPMPGIMPRIDFSEPIFLMAAICWRKSSKVKSSAARNLRSISAAWARSNAFSACSMRVSTSPMSRMRDAIRSGWKTSKSFTPSPVLANMIGRPVTEATDRAAPPRASPSSLVSTTPVTSTPSWKACAVSTAAWPIIASMTKSTSSGEIAARMSAACCIRFSSMARRPAVSTMTTSCWARRACSRPARETATGSPWLRVPSPVSVTTSWPKTLPRSGANTGTPARSPTTSSWVTALGRWRSAATSSGVWPWPLSQ